jgi:hypothetical protein
MPQRVASPAMPKLFLLQFTLDDSQLTIEVHASRKKCAYGGSGRVYKIRASHLNVHRKSQSESQLPSNRLNGVIYVMDAGGSLQQRLQKSYKAVYKSINTVQDGGAVIGDCASAQNGKYINP